MQTFSSRVRSCKAFAAEQKIRELEKLLFKTKALEKKVKKNIKSNKLIRKATNNLNNIKTTKYSFAPGKIEAKSSANDQCRVEYDFYRLQKVKMVQIEGQKKDIRFRKTL